MAKALSEFKFRRLGKDFYGTKRLRWDSLILRTVSCQRYGTTGGIKQMGTHNRSDNVRGAWVVLCAHPTHTDIDSLDWPVCSTVYKFGSWNYTKLVTAWTEPSCMLHVPFTHNVSLDIPHSEQYKLWAPHHNALSIPLSTLSAAPCWSFYSAITTSCLQMCVRYVPYGDDRVRDVCATWNAAAGDSSSERSQLQCTPAVSAVSLFSVVRNYILT
jgi:hypothetical protein